MKDKIKDPLKWVSVAAALAVTATAEYDLAVAIGVNSVVAAAVPAALDAYVLRALQRNKEVLTSVLAMVGVNAASHLQHAGMIPLDWRLTTAVSAIAPLVLWRVHALTDPGTWRLRKIWGTEDKRHVLCTSTRCEHRWRGTRGCPGPVSSTEHERTPDEDTSTGDGAREHTSLVTCDWCAWDACPAHLLEIHKRDSCAERWAHRADAGHGPVPVWEDPSTHARHCDCGSCRPDLGNRAPSTLIRSNAHPYGFGVSTPDELDVPAWLREAQENTLRVLDTVPVPAPVFAPYEDHVDAEHSGEHAGTDCDGGPDCEHACSDIPGQGPACDWDPACTYHFPDTSTASTDRHLSSVPPLPAAFTRSTDRADAGHGDEHTTDHDGLNLGHVSTGVLQPADTRHMERARVLMARTGGVPTVRALKQTLSTGTPVAQRVRAALDIEHTTSTASTDGGTA